MSLKCLIPIKGNFTGGRGGEEKSNKNVQVTVTYNLQRLN
jgi:hypothetical protein